tara:strand:- start:1214 stop:2491 length:1278 start_codon:yes stop_codon:yes gene_type:complete
MENIHKSKNFSLNKSTYINLRWIAIIGQFITINIVKFYFGFEFNFIIANIIVLIGVISNIFLIYYNKSTQISDNIAINFLTLDILQLSALLYLTGGTINPFSIFMIIPSVFASSSLNIKSNLFLIILTTIIIIFLTFFHQELPSPLNNYIFSNHYYYSFPIALIIALVFFNYFALTFGKESRLRKEALDKLQEVMAKEHELVSLGGQAAAAAHSLGTPLSTIKIISQELFDQLHKDKNFTKDVELLKSQVDRCNDILKRLTLNPGVEDDFIDKDLSIYEYISQIVKSFEEISKKKFSLISDQDTNSFKVKKSIELVYGIRNFIGNANKFANNKIYITIKSDSEFTEIIIEDDGKGFPKDVLSKIGEPYIKSINNENLSKSGLGLGIFIGKTLLEKNYAIVNCRNSETRNGAEINIKWKNYDLKKI